MILAQSSDGEDVLRVHYVDEVLHVIEEFADVIPVVRVLLRVEGVVRELVPRVAVTEHLVMPAVHSLRQRENRDIPVVLPDHLHHPVEATNEHSNSPALGALCLFFRLAVSLPVDGTGVRNVDRRLNVFQQVSDIVVLPFVDVEVGVCRGDDGDLPVLQYRVQGSVIPNDIQRFCDVDNYVPDVAVACEECLEKVGRLVAEGDASRERVDQLCSSRRVQSLLAFTRTRGR